MRDEDEKPNVFKKTHNEAAQIRKQKNQDCGNWSAENIVRSKITFDSADAPHFRLLDDWRERESLVYLVSDMQLEGNKFIFKLLNDEAYKVRKKMTKQIPKLVSSERTGQMLHWYLSWKMLWKAKTTK